jgi:hypothetical protein
MFKQPAENTNATPLEEKTSAARVDPSVEPAELHAEIQAEARRVAGSEEYGPEHWNKAQEIVRNRKKSLSKG